MGISRIKFTIVSASRNEEVDISMAIEAMLSQTYSNVEIIIVDDSTDSTKEKIRSFASRGVKLIDGPRRGCCAARNFGIQNATGDVVMFVNADAKLAPDFIERVEKHYAQGADWVLVKSRAFNLENVYARFIQAQADMEEDTPDYAPFTSEGYSCRRELILKAGLITLCDAPLNFCTDWTLGDKITKLGIGKKIFDRSIIANHKAPDHFKEYWQVRKTRGYLSAVVSHYLAKESIPYLFMKFIIKDALFILSFGLLIPAGIRVAKISRYSSAPIKDFIPFYYAYFVQEFSRVLGEWAGLFLIIGKAKHAN